MRHWFSLGLVCCAQLLTSGCADLNPPVISNPGISTTAITSNTISIAWTKASDGLSPPETLVYKVYLSNANPAYQSFDTIAEVEAGTLVATLVDANATSIDNTWITTANASYYINIVVEDEAGNKAVYEPLGEYFHNNQISYYPFSSNANDATASLKDVTATANNLALATGTSLPTTLALPTLTLDRFGHVASAYNFAPTTTTAQCMQSASLMSTLALTGSVSRTVSFWVQSANTTTPGTQRVPFAWGDGNSGGSSFGASEDGTTWSAWLGGTSDGATTAAVTTNWEHWVIGYNGTTVLAYKNGAAVAVTPSVVSATTLDSKLYVGCGMDAGLLQHPYLGKIDDLRIFNVLLGSTDVATLYDATKP